MAFPPLEDSEIATTIYSMLKSPGCTSTDSAAPNLTVLDQGSTTFCWCRPVLSIQMSLWAKSLHPTSTSLADRFSTPLQQGKIQML